MRFISLTVKLVVVVVDVETMRNMEREPGKTIGRLKMYQ